MKISIFGLSISSSWGNGHATLWRGLVRALIRDGHRVSFFERDVPYYAHNRDLWQLEGLDLVLYSSWMPVESRVRETMRQADAVIITSFCPDAIAASEDLYESERPLKVFYDLDTPVTLKNIEDGNYPSYIDKERLLKHYDLVLSYTGGQSLDSLKQVLGAKNVAPLYGSADPDFHYPVASVNRYRADLSYLGTYAADRQDALEKYFVTPAYCAGESIFQIGGAQYPPEINWPFNVRHITHVPPPEHPSFYCSGRFTLNITRASMAKTGYCPSGRLFEAGACGTAILSDTWEGLESFFTGGSEIMIVRKTEDVLDALTMSERERSLLIRNARERVLEQHTSANRAGELIRLLENTVSDRM